MCAARVRRRWFAGGVVIGGTPTKTSNPEHCPSGLASMLGATTEAEDDGVTDTPSARRNAAHTVLSKLGGGTKLSIKWVARRLQRSAGLLARRVQGGTEQQARH
jgi:hypothetical protein